MKSDEIKQVIDKVNIFDIPYDVGVFRPEKLVSRFINPRWNRGVSKSLGAGDLMNIKSVVVYVLFTNVPVDYYVKFDLSLNLLTWFKYNSNYPFYYDDYGILRKEAAVYGGLGKLGKNKLFFSSRFGFNCKIDLILTQEEFDEYYDFTGDYKLKYCENCDICFKACPSRALYERLYKNFEYKCLSTLGKDNRVFTDYRLTKDICYKCNKSCPYSKALAEKIPEEIRDRRFRWELIEGPEYKAMWPYSFRNI